MEGALLNFYQSIQLLALGPCLFVAFFLLVAVKPKSHMVVPVLFFLSLAASFALPLKDILYAKASMALVLRLCETLTPVLSFLFIVQIALRRVPPSMYWGVLMVPLVGGGMLSYAAWLDNVEDCVPGRLCIAPLMLQQLYEIISSLLVLLLAVMLRKRLAISAQYNKSVQHNALIYALLILNLALLGITLAQIGQIVMQDRAQLAITVVRIGFIYIMMTALFRVPDDLWSIAYEQVPTLKPSGPTERDQMLATQLNAVLREEKLYRTMHLSRAVLAEKLNVSEHQLSRAVNQCMRQSVSALVNYHRIEEAKIRLATEKTSVTAIAFEVGFNSIPSFNRVFRQSTGISPTEYRRRSMDTVS